MDLSLRGSQINLATRYKPKTPTIKYPVLQRPGSASCSRLTRGASPILRRPQSADQKFCRRLDNSLRFRDSFFGEGKLRKNKKFLSTSSSNLLKILLDEPIRRPWLCRDSDERSDISLGQQICNIANAQARRTDSFEDISTEEDNPSTATTKEDLESSQYIKGQNRNYPQRTEIAKDTFASSKNNLPTTQNQTFSNKIVISGMFSSQAPTSQPSTSQGDFWHETKPDLPGRVSFGKADICEVDLSDSENNFQPNSTTNTTTTTTSAPPNNKKSVHFGEGVEGSAEVYEYPKCPSENCSCDETTRNSLEVSSPDSVEIEMHPPKCVCEFSCNSSDYTSLTLNQKSYTENYSRPMPQDDEESEFVKQYKEQLEADKKLELEVKMIERDEGKLNNSGDTDFFDKDLESKLTELSNNKGENYSYTTTSSVSFENHQQNNLSDRRNRGSNISLVNNVVKVDNIRAKELAAHATDGSTSVIKNFLEVSRAQVVPNKKQNNSAVNKRKTKTMANRRSKSASASEGSKTHKIRLQKTGTYTCLREDSNIDEFQLDNVDSWMSLHNVDQQPKHNYSSLKKTPKYYPEQYEDHDDFINSEDRSENVSEDSSTYDEIVSVIKEIDEDRKKVSHEKALDVQLKLQTILQSDTTSESTPKDNVESPDKLKDILSYLEDVENSCERTLMETRRSLPETNRSEIEYAIEPDIVESVPKLSDLLMLPNHQLARRVIALSLRANELANAIHLSKEHVGKIRQDKQKAVRLEKQNTGNRLRDQKKYYEGIVARHQGFIEQLLKDKASLCEKVTALTRRLDSQNQAWEHKLETEVSRAKETTLAGEKIRRERWVRENTKKIKELTVKGLEAEINKMNTNHQQEITELKRFHQQELLDAVEEVRLKYEQMEKSIRDSCAKDREATIEKERNAIRERFDRQLQDEQKAFDEQKNKLLEDIAAERERLQNEYRQKESEWQTKIQDLEREKEIAIERAYSECQAKMEQQEQKYQNRINTIEKQFESDFVIWKREFESACKLREVDNENAIRQHYRAERDRQIDAIVSRMDAESLKCHEEFDIKISRLKEKHENDLREAEHLENSLRDKYNDARSRLAEADAQVQNLQAEVKQLHLELDHSKRMCDEFLIEKEQLKENAREEVQNEVANLKAERDDEIQRIYKRVQQAIEKKDTTIEILQKENSSLRERCIKLETIIRQQRKDYCIK